MKRTFVDYIEDIVESIDLIEEFTKSMKYEDFCTDMKTNYAVIRAIEIIGEASKNIPDELKEESPNIPWYKMAGIRNKIAHEYFGLSTQIVWNVVKKELPALKKDILILLQKYDKSI